MAGGVRTRGLISGICTVTAALSSLAPAATQARNTATSAGFGCLAFFGGIGGLALPSGRRTRQLSSGLPAAITGPLPPPFRRASNVSMTRPPLASSALWHSRQYLARNGLTCLV